MLVRLSDAAARLLERRPSLVLVALASLAAVHLLTIAISPTIWQDEVQTVDFGRNVVTYDPTWSISWGAAQRPVTPLSYLGPVLQEIAYRALAPSMLGPRLSALLGALVAACLIFLWLRSRLVSAGPAFALSVVFLLDPVFVQGYRGARVDCWVIAVVIAACILVRRSPGGPRTGAHVSRRLVLPGGLLVLACFLWPSAIFLFPLVAAEAIAALAPLAPSPGTVLRWGLAATAGGLLVLALCLFPVAGQLSAVMADTGVTVQANSSVGSLWTRLPAAVWQLVLSYQHSPFLPLAAAAAAWSRGNRVLTVAAVAAALAMLPTQVYVHRVAYLLPYLIGLVGESWRRAPVSRPQVWHAAAVTVALIWAASLSLVARPALALTVRHARDSARLVEAAAQMPDLRNQRVYLGPWEFYYAGRQLGWKMVRAYGGVGSEASEAMFANLDYALLNEAQSAQQRGFLAATGWQLIQQVTLPSVEAAYPLRPPAKPRHYDLYARRVQATTD